MTTGMPELGSKISLISKADIRYEGRLFTVDPQECTIALASVRSFGTEDRETQYQVAAQNQVYDYILFRGSDIKDIRVINNVAHAHPQTLNDPAIMQLSVPPTLGGQPFQNHPVLGPMAPQMGQFAGPYGGMAAAMGGLGSAMGGSMQTNTRVVGSSKPTSVLDLIGGSRSTTPASLGSRKSPTIDQGVQAGGSKHDEKNAIKPIQPPGQRNQQRKRSRERRSSGRDEGQHQNRSGLNRNQHNVHQSGHYNREHGQNYQNYQNYHNNQGNQQRGGWSNQRGGPPMRPRGRPRGGYRNQPNNQGNGRSKNTLKFDNDYDFEQANTEFEELRSQLGKLKVEEASSTSTKSEVNGDVDKKDDSGNETGAGEPEPEEDHEVYYDKTKSFFDKISCEAVERAKGKSQRTDWRVERKLNSETFGVSSTRRGHFRGRGGYRGQGYRGGYRPNNYRQPQRREQQSSSQQQPKQQQQQHQQHQQQGNRTDQSDKQQNVIAQNEPSLSVKETTLSIEGVSASASSSGTDLNSKPSQSQSCNNKKGETIPEPAMAVN